MLPSGNPQGKILILGDYPSRVDQMFQQPLREDSASLAQLLHEAGMILGECHVMPHSREGQGGLFCVTVSYEVTESKLVEALAQLVGLPGAVG